MEPLAPPSPGYLLLMAWEKELANGREGKMVAKNTTESIFNVDQTKGFIKFINSKVAGEYKTIW